MAVKASAAAKPLGADLGLSTGAPTRGVPSASPTGAGDGPGRCLGLGHGARDLPGRRAFDWPWHGRSGAAVYFWMTDSGG